MDNKYNDFEGFGIEYTTHDRLLRAWENTMELVRDFEMYSKRVEDEDVKETFKKFAEDEGFHASALRELILKKSNTKGH
jgi:rubrerythrin